jgi:hypothetical protein
MLLEPMQAPLRRPIESNILLVSPDSYQCLRIAKFGFERGMTPILGMTTARRKAIPSATPLSGDHRDPQTGSFASPPCDGFALSVTSIKQAVRSYRKCLRCKTDGRVCKIAIKRFGACSYRSREQMRSEMLSHEDPNLDSICFEQKKSRKKSIKKATQSFRGWLLSPRGRRVASSSRRIAETSSASVTTIDVV